MRASQSRPPGNITEVMRMLEMSEYLPVFVLNGYEDLTLFKDLDDDELDYLGITNLKQRQKLIDMANLLFPDEKSPGEGDSSDSSDSEDSSSESGIADINSDEAYSSYNSNKHNWLWHQDAVNNFIHQPWISRNKSFLHFYQFSSILSCIFDIPSSVWHTKYQDHLLEIKYQRRSIIRWVRSPNVKPW